MGHMQSGLPTPQRHGSLICVFICDCLPAPCWDVARPLESSSPGQSWVLGLCPGGSQVPAVL